MAEAWQPRTIAKLNRDSILRQSLPAVHDIVPVILPREEPRRELKQNFERVCLKITEQTPMGGCPPTNHESSVLRGVKESFPAPES